MGIFSQQIIAKVSGPAWEQLLLSAKGLTTDWYRVTFFASIRPIILRRPASLHKRLRSRFNHRATLGSPRWNLCRFSYLS